MTKQTEALKMAHKTFMQLNERHPRRDNEDGCFDRELKAINEALEQPSVAELNDEYLRDTHVEGLQPAQEPVAWVKDNLICPENNYETTRTEEHPKDLGWTPLYSHPAPQPAQEPVLLNVKTHDDKTYKVEVSAPSWQGLSDDELDALNGSPMALEHSSLYKFARAIEQELKTKNGFSGLKEKNNAM